jgi:hypothetical protein
MVTDKLSNEEIDCLYGLPYNVALLIASADGYIDEAEIRKAISVIQYQASYSANADLSRFFEEINHDAEDKIRVILSATPRKPQERILYLSKKIVDANIVLKKLNRSFVAGLHQSLCNLAKQIAKASGGVFGYGGIGPEESNLLDLSLLEFPN